MSESQYANALKTIELLTPAEQLRLVADLTDRLARRIEPQASRSILELRGLGKEVWSGVDPDQYVNEERSSWSG